MEGVVALLIVTCAASVIASNITINNIEGSSLQLLEFKLAHPYPIGIKTLTAGEPTDLRDNFLINSELSHSELVLDDFTNLNREKIPERIVHAKGGGAWGYFEVTHDVSKYTKAELFNGVGKKTPLVLRFSTALQSLGGRDSARDIKGVAMKFFTKEGNLDLLGGQFPVYFYRDPKLFQPFVHAFKPNPKTGLFDVNAQLDLVARKPETFQEIVRLMSDYGAPANYRQMDIHPIHTFHLVNKNGESHFVKFNFRTEQGLANLTDAQQATIIDNDIFNRDLYNAIHNGSYPAWRLEMDVMTVEDIKHVDYNPFEVIIEWKPGTYKTVPIGRMVINKHTDNVFRDIELGAFCPSNLVPGIPGPIDIIFRSRRIAYRDTQNYRLGKNFNRILVNEPYVVNTYTRDGVPPVGLNMGDTPNYYPNGFNGPVPYIDETRPKEKLKVLESNAIDLQFVYDFIERYARDDAHKQRIVGNFVNLFSTVYPKTQDKIIRLVKLSHTDLGQRLRVAVDAARNAGLVPSEDKPLPY